MAGRDSKTARLVTRPLMLAGPRQRASTPSSRSGGTAGCAPAAAKKYSKPAAARKAGRIVRSLGQVDEDLPGHLVGGSDGDGPDFHLTFIEVAAQLRFGQAGDLQGQRQQLEEFTDPLLGYAGLHRAFSAHGVLPSKGATKSAYPGGTEPSRA